MKGYENIPRTYLTRRMPCIIRIDGKAFHTFTRGLAKPWDPVLAQVMWDTAVNLCMHIEGCQLAYIQSDEISLLLTDYAQHTTEAWFGKSIQKMTSVSASMATLYFNRLYQSTSGALFDSRVFVLPKEEVCNYFVWRQQDATRNAIEALGRAHFSSKELHKVNCKQIQEKLFTEKGVNFNDMPTSYKRGTCVVKEKYLKDGIERTRWGIDNEIPVFTADRQYIESRI